MFLILRAISGKDVNSSCYGHSKHDVLSWKNIFDDDDYYYTNAELYDMFDPTVFTAAHLPSFKKSSVSLNLLFLIRWR